MEFIAIQKYLRTSPRKLREVVPVVKHLKPSDALNKLLFVRKRAALPLRKVVNTAIANAKQKGVSDIDLVFKEIQINEGPTLKRWRAGARGRAKPYEHRMSHIKVVLETKKPQQLRKARETKVEKEKLEKTLDTGVKVKSQKERKNK